MRTTKFCVLLCAFLLCLTALAAANVGNKTEEEAKQYLTALESEYSKRCNTQMVARWNYVVNVTNDTSKESVEALNNFLEFQASVQLEILQNFSWADYSDESFKRQLTFLSIRGPGNTPPADIAKMNKIANEMETSYATSTVCDYKNGTKCDLKLGDIENLLTKLTDYDELAHYWTSWHDVMGRAVTPQTYKKFVDYQNQMAKANGFQDMSELWIEPYNDGTPNFPTYFKNYIKQLWEELQPNFNKFHAYVRMKLREVPKLRNKIKKFGYLPANLLGNLWGQDWSSLDSITRPYPNISSLDATEAMVKTGYTVKKMFEVSDDFFASLGLAKMTSTFWEKSSLTAPPPPTEKVCHASAEDFCNGAGSDDFRINMCTKVTMGDLVTVHHEMGHIEYFMQYKNQPYIFREGANPGFHEAIGDALALAVTTPQHLQCELKLELGLDCADKTGEANSTSQKIQDINFLYLMALQKFPLLPFAVSMDSWRWEVFEGKLDPEQYNKRWWEIRQENQGIKPPTSRPPDSFDAAAKYHIVSNVPYIRYFLSHILQFQFYQAMCEAAGQFNATDPGSKPLHQCDFSGSLAAGQKLKEMMELGFSKPWPDALEKITGNPTMNVGPLLTYFKPLFDYIDEELKANGQESCFGVACNSLAQKYLNSTYEPAVLKAINKQVVADFTYLTDLNNQTKENATLDANIELANFQFKEWNETIRHFEYSFDALATDSNDTILTKRQLKFLNAVGTAVLPADELKEYNSVLAEMSKTYGTAKICPYNKSTPCDIAKEGLTLEPGIESILATSNDYDELAYAWKAWRDASGKKVRDQYNVYVNRSNHAAVLNGFSDMSDFWILRYESETFKTDMAALWETVKPLYLELHAYVRYKLKSKYGERIKDNEPIPAHILGNMWAQSWENIYSDVVPFANDSIFDVTDKLKEKYNDTEESVRQLFGVADEFFTSLGLKQMAMAYGEKAMIVKPSDGREVVCHASAWDFFDGEDYRLKMCTDVNMEDFITIHHELGHIQYYLNYNHLPSALREGANPGFHEAIGDVIALSVATPKHMVKLELMDPTPPTHGSTINYLMKMALEKVAFLPFGFLIDSYRWKVFDGTIPKENLTYHWLKMRNEFQGVVPPVTRGEDDFDPGAKYHVPGNTPYIRYFVSYILQFQIHKALCIAAGEYEKGNSSKPLHECDIYNNTAAGDILRKILQSGLSQSWRALLESSIGKDNLDSMPIMEYFLPLMTFLVKERAEKNYSLSWREDAFEDFYTRVKTTQSPEDHGTIATGIIVGIVVGIAIIVILVGYIVGRRFKK